MFWDTIDSIEPFYAAGEALAFFVILCTFSTHDHYTWWNLFIVFGYDIGLALSLKWPFLKSTVKRYWLAVLLSALTVVAGVIVMSLLSCDLLSEIYHEEGPLKYTAGNFVVHYLPMCHLAFWPDFKHWSTRHAQEMAGLAAGPIVLYALLFNPNTIYECTKTSHSLSTLLLVMLPIFTFLGGFFIDLTGAQQENTKPHQRAMTKRK